MFGTSPARVGDKTSRGGCHKAWHQFCTSTPSEGMGLQQPISIGKKKGCSGRSTESSSAPEGVAVPGGLYQTGKGDNILTTTLSLWDSKGLLPCSSQASLGLGTCTRRQNVGLAVWERC